MPATIDLNEHLLERAAILTGTSDPTTLINQALQELIRRECARRLALAGGTEPGARPTPRRRSRTGNS